MADPAREYPDTEIERSLGAYAGWFGFLGERPDHAILALQWKASQGDKVPVLLKPLRDALAQFGHAPIEEAVTRVQGLEKAFAEISEIMQGGISCDAENAQKIRDIVDSCVKYSGGFGEEEEATDV